MITLTRLNGSTFALNCDLIERIEATPDTVVVLLDGSKYVVSDGVDDVVTLIRRHRAEIVALCHRLEAAAVADARPAAPVLQLLTLEDG